MTNQFPIGAWTYLPIENAQINDVKLWKECGLTLTMSPQYDPEKDDKKKMLIILDECCKNNIKLIICDKRSEWTGAAANPELYRKLFREAYNDFGHHSAVWGFHVGDEPREAEKADLLEAYKIQSEEAPELVPFVNFLSFYKPEIRVWMDNILKEFSPKYLCYDRYSQMVLEDSGTEDYFSDLREYRKIADRKGVPMWTTLMCVGHMRYRIPTEEDLLWQLNTSLACGCNGIMWFLFYNLRHQVNYRKAPIDMFGNPTETYHRLAYILHEFHELYAETFTHLKLIQSYHVGRAWGGYPHFKEGDSNIILRAATLNETDAILSFFKDEYNNDYLAVVCNSKTEICELSLTVSKNAGRMIRVGASKQYKDVYINHFDESFEDGETAFTYTPWLAPGQMNLYKFERD